MPVAQAASPRYAFTLGSTSANNSRRRGLNCRCNLATNQCLLPEDFAEFRRKSANEVYVRHVHRLRRKLECGGVRIHIVRGLGYKLEESHLKQPGGNT